MLFIQNFKRIIREAFTFLSRKKVLAFSSLLILTLSSLSLFFLFLFHDFTQFTIKQLEKRIDIGIYFDPDAPKQFTQKVFEKIQSFPEVEEVKFVEKEKALSAFQQRHYNDPLILRSLEELGGNPLGDSIMIRAKTSSAYQKIVEKLYKDDFIIHSPYIEYINYSDSKKLIERLNIVLSLIQKTSYSGILLFSIIFLLILYHSIRIYFSSFENEIKARVLLGAEKRHIVGPFLVIGMIFGFFSGIFSFFVSERILFWLGKQIYPFVGTMNIYTYFQKNLFPFLLLIVSASMLLSYLASMFAARSLKRD